MSFLPLLLFLLWISALVISVAVDTRRHRQKPEPQPLSVLIPSYNAGKNIVQTVESVFASWPCSMLDVQVINDASTDDTATLLAALAERFPIRIIHQTQNLGKALSLNRAVHSCKNDLVLFLDADTQLNPKAIPELLARMLYSPRLGAVSCPCTPANSGVLPSMQALEYNMHRLFMGASNLFSVHALWGGCLMTRVSVFLANQGFASNAIAEDTDYAFRLNQNGLRVEQCRQHVKTVVPDRLHDWFRQKIRWTSGLFQCGFRYPRVWASSPVILFTFAVNLALLTSGVLGWFDNFNGADLFHTLSRLHQHHTSVLSTLLALTEHDPAMVFVLNLLTGLGFFLFSIVFVLPLVNTFRDTLKLALIIPYTLGYLPLFTLVSAAGFIFWAVRLRKLSKQQRAW